MIKKELTIAYVKLHTAVIIFGFTAILGKLINLPSIALIWNRLWISSLGLLLLPGVWKGLKNLPRKDLLTFSGIGLIVAIHWVAFYGSIKLGNSVSVALACFATTPLFTSLIEPLIVKKKLHKTEIFLGIVTIIGVYFVSGVGEFYYKAIAAGILSAITASLFSVLNKKHLAKNNELSVSVLEFTSGWVFLSLLLPLYFNTPGFHLFPDPNNFSHPWDFNFLGIHSDWFYLLLLGIFGTCLGFVFILQALRHVSAFTSNLSINLEPVYGFVLAALFFQENNQLNAEFYSGASLILLCVVLHPVFNQIEKRNERRKNR